MDMIRMDGYERAGGGHGQRAATVSVVTVHGELVDVTWADPIMRRPGICNTAATAAAAMHAKRYECILEAEVPSRRSPS